MTQGKPQAVEPAHQRTTRLVIAGGGTGGHVFPGVAVAEALHAYGLVEVLWIGTGRPVEEKVLAGRGWDVRVLRVRPLQGANLLGMARALAGLPVATARAWGWLRAFRPHVVFGVGGYVSGPVLLAARFLGTPTALHEQNVIPGLANRLGARFAKRIFVSFRESAAYFPSGRVQVTGNPVRQSVIAPMEGNLSEKGQGQTVLVLGGSQGASGLNRLACKAFKVLWGSGFDVRVIHQTGDEARISVEEGYSQARDRAEVRSFIHDMGAAYRQSDLVLCRAGATTVAELAAVARPAVLVPYPLAASGHQEANAVEMVKAGAAVLVREGETDAETLASKMRALLENPARLAKMGQRAASLARPSAAAEIARALAQLAHGSYRGETRTDGAQKGCTVHSYV